MSDGGALPGPLALPSARIRRSPFWDGTHADAVRSATVYNHTLLPCVFESLEDDYRHLKTHVQLWDVACQRQVEIEGREAAKLVQMITPRPLEGLKPGRCAYVPAVDRNGRMLNDPVLLKLAEDRFWFSVADSDLVLYALGAAGAAGLDVRVSEPDILPLAVQGPKSQDLIERMFGSGAAALSFFGFGRFAFRREEFIVARSGWSKQDGFEIYVRGTESYQEVWSALTAAGADLDVRAGCPNYIERIEGGLLSYGGDITREHSPYECGLEAYFDAAAAVGCLGRDALLRERDNGIRRQIRCVRVDGGPVPACDRHWTLSAGDREAGRITAAAWSPDFEMNVAIAMVDTLYWDEGERLQAETPAGIRGATVRSGFPG